MGWQVGPATKSGFNRECLLPACLSNFIFCCYSLLPIGKRLSRLTYSSHRLEWWMLQMWVYLTKVCSDTLSLPWFLPCSPDYEITYRSLAPCETSRTLGLAKAQETCQCGPILVWASPSLLFHGSLPWAHFLAYGTSPTWFTDYLELSTQVNSPVFSSKAQQQGLFTQGNPHRELLLLNGWWGSCGPEAHGGNHHCVCVCVCVFVCVFMNIWIYMIYRIYMKLLVGQPWNYHQWD